MKKTAKAALFLFLLSSIVFAQKKVGYGLVLSGETGFVNAKLEGSTSLAQGFIMGAFIQYNAQRVFFRGGLDYGMSRQSLKTPFIWPNDYSPLPQIDNFAAQTVSLSSTMINVPLEIGYRFPMLKENSYRFLAGIGGTFHTGLTHSSSLKIFYENGENERFPNGKNDLNTNGLSFRIFAGIERKYGKNYFLGLEPYFRLTGDLYRVELFRSNNEVLVDFGLSLRIRRQ